MLRRASLGAARHRKALPLAVRQTIRAQSTRTVGRLTQSEAGERQKADSKGKQKEQRIIPPGMTLSRIHDPKSELIPEDSVPDLPVPLAVQSIYFAPLKRQAKYRVPVCDLQIRSFDVRSLEFFCDFALRAAYYLKLPAAGPVPLPKRTERWTVPRSNFVHKKAQENFERVTFKRLIQIQDGHPDVVQIWLAFLRKHEYHGLGLKANVFTFERPDVGKKMSDQLEMTRKMAAEEALDKYKQVSRIKSGFKRSVRGPPNPMGIYGTHAAEQRFIEAEDEYMMDLEQTQPIIEAAERDEKPGSGMPDEHEEEEYQKREREKAVPREEERLKEHEQPSGQPGAGDKPEEVEGEKVQHRDPNETQSQKHEEIMAQAEDKPTSAPKPGEPEQPPQPSENEELVHQDREDEVPKELKEAKERQDKGEEAPQELSAQALSPITASKSEASSGHPEDHMPREMEEGQTEGQEDPLATNESGASSGHPEDHMPREMEEGQTEGQGDPLSTSASGASSGHPEDHMPREMEEGQTEGQEDPLATSKPEPASDHVEDLIPREMEEGQEENRETETSSHLGEGEIEVEERIVDAPSGGKEIDVTVSAASADHTEKAEVVHKTIPLTPETAQPEPTASEDAVAADKLDIDVHSMDPIDIKLAKDIEIKASPRAGDSTEVEAEITVGGQGVVASGHTHVPKAPEPTESEAAVAADSDYVPEPTQNSTKDDFRNAKEIQVEEAIKKDS